MFDTYDRIFDRRGAAYHRAMRMAPAARAEEFRTVLGAAELAPGQVLCDVPAGGGYLVEHLPADLDVRVIAVDPSEAFARTWDDPRVEGHLAPLDAVPLDDGAADVIVSVAGLHHVEDRGAVFAEMRRILRRGGRLCVLEVEAGAITDRFLNDFVHRHNRDGHVGRFVDDRFRDDLRRAGFRLVRDEACRYAWNFSDESEMTEYVRLMFGLDRADAATVRDGIATVLGCGRDGGRTRMNWELRLLVGE